MAEYTGRGLRAIRYDLRKDNELMKRELIFAAVVGGCFGALLTIMLGLVVPLGALSGEDGHFDVVTCKEVKVVDLEGKGVSIQSVHSSGLIVVDGSDGGKVMISGIGPDSGRPFIHVFGKEKEGSAGISIDDNGGCVEVFGKEDLGLRAEMRTY